MTRRHLPQEIVDHIVDHLRNDSETLKQCSLVSKSWVPRVQRNLFFEIRFKCSEDLEAWKRAFPDPANSPVYHTRSLVVACIDITAADVEAGGWIHAFSKVVRLEACRGARNLRFPSYNDFSLSRISLRSHKRVHPYLLSTPS